mmetsp:Transcript_32910/g.73924  ORF Transcript_32910/g.73924 Transcript_32910/m.73924 type:complete len:214 (+) Transcript_32910:443-1084(+)
MPKRRPDTPRLEPSQAPGPPHVKPIEVSARVAPERLQNTKPTSQGQCDGVEQALLSPWTVMDLSVDLILPELAPDAANARYFKDVLDEPASCRDLFVVLCVSQPGVRNARLQAAHVLAFPTVILACSGKIPIADLVSEGIRAFNLTKRDCKPCFFLPDAPRSCYAFHVLKGARLEREIIRDVWLDKLHPKSIRTIASACNTALQLFCVDAKVP